MGPHTYYVFVRAIRACPCVTNDAQSVREGGAELNQRMLDQLEEAARRLQQAVETTDGT